MPEPILRVTTESGAVYEFSEGMEDVKCSREVWDAITQYALPPDEWHPCAYTWIQMGYGMRIGLNGGDTLRLTTPVVSIEGVE